MVTRTILHVDMDAFYASVEEQDNKDLIGKPVIVGGLSSQGVVTTANYEARKYGVHSAMPGFIARKKCPKGIFLKGRMGRYKEVSDKVYKILTTYTDKIEKVSIDESYLDISNIDEDPLKIVELIKEEVLLKTGLTMSIGISYNKFLAKLASDWNKPNGLKVITRDMLPEILFPLPISSVYGIGNKTKKKLNDIAIYTVEDLYRLSEEFLLELLGKLGLEIYSRIRGEDSREVEVNRERKSLGIERTFIEDTKDRKKLERILYDYSIELEKELKSRSIHTKTIVLKLKDSTFKVQTRSKTLSRHISSHKDIYKISRTLLDEIEIENNIRLIGITGANLISSDLKQLSLFKED